MSLGTTKLFNISLNTINLQIILNEVLLDHQVDEEQPQQLQYVFSSLFLLILRIDQVDLVGTF